MRHEGTVQRRLREEAPGAGAQRQTRFNGNRLQNVPRLTRFRAEAERTILLSRRFVRASETRDGMYNSVLFEMEPLVLWSAAACRRFAPCNRGRSASGTVWKH